MPTPRRAAAPVLAAALLLAACTAVDATPSETLAPDTPEPTAAMTEAPEATEDPGATEAPGDGAPDSASVALLRFQFSEESVTIAAGGTITFSNGDSAAHTVTEGSNGAAAEGARFNEEVGGGASVDITFDEPGTYDVTCLFHPSMNMTVVVEG